MPPDHRQVHRDPIRNNDHVQFFGVLCVRKLRKRQVSAFIDSLKFLINCLNLYESFFVFCFLCVSGFLKDYVFVVFYQQQNSQFHFSELPMPTESGLPFPRRIFSSEEWGKLGNFPKKFWGMGKIWGKF